MWEGRRNTISKQIQNSGNTSTKYKKWEASGMFFLCNEGDKGFCHIWRYSIEWETKKEQAGKRSNEEKSGQRVLF